MTKTTINKLVSKLKSSIFLLGCILLISGCEDFLEVEDPFGQIPNAEVFEDETTATAAITTLYAKMRDQMLLSGDISGIGFAMGLYADELDYFNTPGHALEMLYQHQVLPSNAIVQSFWNTSFQLIYLCNASLEGLGRSNTLSQEFKDQLMGETLFVRAMTYFYLASLFGDIPYITTTDHTINQQIFKTDLELVYENIISDLNQSKTLLAGTDISGERTRANQWVISAFLARVHLYIGQWQQAEVESSVVIQNNALFQMETNIDEEFLKESSSTILQLAPKNPGDNTKEASIYIFSSGSPPFAALNENFVHSMEPGDLRRLLWIGEVNDGDALWYYPYKYKQNNNTGVSLEYSIILRLAEQHLIRAEARIRQGDFTGAQEDINRIRQRAGLQNTEAYTEEALIEVILQERRSELFTEHGHRWFDLRRFGVAAAILSPIKPGWKPTNILLPIPESELLMNPNLNPQNPGY